MISDENFSLGKRKAKIQSDYAAIEELIEEYEEQQVKSRLLLLKIRQEMLNLSDVSEENWENWWK